MIKFDSQEALAAGTWEVATWKLFKCVVAPPHELCTAVFCIPLFKNDVILIFNESREQWEFPGGHIETGETPVEAVHREVDEEAKSVVENPELVGVVEVTSLLTAETAKQKGFPYPLSYILYYKADVTHMLDVILTHEIRTRKLFTKDDAKKALLKAGLHGFQGLF